MQALDALYCRYFDVMKVLTYLLFNGRNEEQREAKKKIHFSEQFSTIILIIVQNKVLEII